MFEVMEECGSLSMFIIIASVCISTDMPQNLMKRTVSGYSTYCLPRRKIIVLI